MSRYETKGTVGVRQEVPAYCFMSSMLIIALLQSKLFPFWSNDVSCSVVGLAVFVPLSYYYLLLSGQIEDSDKVRQLYTSFFRPVKLQMQLMLTLHQTSTQAPAWTSPVLHTGNVIAAILDLLSSTTILCH